MLFAFGSNGSGQLGLGHDEDLAVPQSISSLPLMHDSSEIKHLVAGGNHTVILYTSGRAFTSGENGDGRCATEGSHHLGKFQEVCTPERSQSPLWEGVAATWSATVLTQRGGEEVWVCGTGESGELGRGEGTTESKLLTRIPSFPPSGKRVVQLAACMAHVVAVLDDGEVWGWGKGRKGQLGEVTQDAWTPRKVIGPNFRVAKAVCGKDFTCLFGSQETGEVLMLGPTGRDRFELKAKTPSKVPGWKQVSASWGNVFVLQETGKVLAWGRDDHGQLPPAELPLVARVAAGSEHCLASTLDGKVLVWGWGEHGNCGEHTDAKGDVKGGWNDVSVSGQVTDIFAGCATSFIYTTAVE